MPKVKSNPFLPVAFSLFFIMFLFSCAYFNTFYNAEEYFRKAEKSRLEKRGESLPMAAAKDYQKVIEKSLKVLDTYPDTKFKRQALTLMGKAHYYRREYRQAEELFVQTQNEYEAQEKDEMGYWLALIKWKKGQPQPALDNMDLLLKEDLTPDLQSRLHQAKAEILMELDMKTEAMNQLDQAASWVSSRSEKGQIYYRIANISYESKQLERALEAYKQVIKYSLSKKQVQESHLKRVQIYRQQENNDKVSELIRSMLLDDNFSTIHGDLELELVRIYQVQEKHDEAFVRLESITNDYPKTRASAEAFYHLGNYKIWNYWDLEGALKQYDKVSKEYRESPFTRLAQMKIKEIKAYTLALEKVAAWNEKKEAPSDSLDTLESQIDILADNPDKAFYSLAELEVFHFNRPREGIKILDQLISDFPESDWRPKALYTRSYLAAKVGEKSLADSLKIILLNQYPKTDYAAVAAKSISTNKSVYFESEKLFRKAEESWGEFEEESLGYFNTIVSRDTVSDFSLRAAYFLAHQYDYYFHQADSAIKYYEWILKYHQDSEQAEFSSERKSSISAILNPEETPE